MSESPLRLLFLKETMAWPRASGHDVHTFYMMQALAAAGHRVALATIATPDPRAIENAGLDAHFTFDRFDGTPQAALNLSKWEEKFRGYWGIDERAICWLGDRAAEFAADTVVVSGLRVLPYLGALPAGTQAVWYAADEWVWHHLSQVSLLKKSTWHEARQALDKGLYERAYRRRLDRVWVVSQPDARAFRWFAGIRKLDVLPNGVDAEHYAPGDETPLPNSCVFWGRLDFGPNVQALEWFLRKVWPRIVAAMPSARFDVFGFQPTPEAIALCERPGVSLTADNPDIRSAVRSRQVVVLPFTSGGGIKNKLLEAAALAMPIVATSRGLAGLKGTPPMTACDRAATFADAVVALFKDESSRRTLGSAARAWAIKHHTWSSGARIAAAGLASSRSLQAAS